jgi:hypothetical protein
MLSEDCFTQIVEQHKPALPADEAEEVACIDGEHELDLLFGQGGVLHFRQEGGARRSKWSHVADHCVTHNSASRVPEQLRELAEILIVQRVEFET